MHLHAEYDQAQIADADILTLKSLVEKSMRGEGRSDEEWPFQFVKDFEADMLAYIFQTIQEITEAVCENYLGAEKINFRKVINLNVGDGTIIKAQGIHDFVDTVRPYFNKVRGYFRGKDKKKAIKVKGKVVYNRNTGKPLTVGEFKGISDTITKLLSDRLDGADEELAVKGALFGLLARQMEKEGMPEKKMRSMSYEELNKKYQLPDRIEVAKKRFGIKTPLENAIRFSKERAGEWLRIPDGRVRNAIVSAVRKQVTQALQEKLSPQQLQQRLFYIDTSDKVPIELRGENIDRINRDWRRVAMTELSMSLNNGYLMSHLEEADGAPVYAYFDGFWSVDDKPGSPTDCNKWLGTVARVFEEARNPKLTGDPYARFAIWPGKMNVDKNATPSIPVHPHCKHWWKTFNPLKQRPAIINMKTGKELPASELKRQRNINKQGDVQVVLVDL